MNNVSLVGNLTKDPAPGVTGNGINYCRFILAVQRTFKNAEGKYDADFIPCVAWRKTADFVEKYFSKGSKIGITGSIRTGSYEKEGVRHYTTEVNVDNVEFAGGGKGAQTANAQRAPEQLADDPVYGEDSIDTDFQPLDDSELPF